MTSANPTTLESNKSLVCHPGRSRRECEYTVVVGSSTGRGPAQAMCAHTAGFEGIAKGERATGYHASPLV